MYVFAQLMCLCTDRDRWTVLMYELAVFPHIVTFWTLVYLWGGLPYLTCGVVRKFYCINVNTYINELENSHLSSETNLQQGVGGTITYHGTGIVNSACHILGSRAWNTKDTSRNIWYILSLVVFLET